MPDKPDDRSVWEKIRDAMRNQGARSNDEEYGQSFIYTGRKKKKTPAQQAVEQYDSSKKEDGEE